VLKDDLKGLRRILVGFYRVFYEIREGDLAILGVTDGRRKDVHRVWFVGSAVRTFRSIRSNGREALPIPAQPLIEQRYPKPPRPVV